MGLRQHRLFRPAVGAVLTVLAGLALWGTRLGGFWVNASYDYPFGFGTQFVPQQLVLIQMDNESFETYGQKRGEPWDRALHAELLNWLANDGCKLVVFDSRFRQATNSEKDKALAEALSRQNAVVLMARVDDGGAQFNSPTMPDFESIASGMPADYFLNAAKTNWGIAFFQRDTDFVVRHHWPFPAPQSFPSLSWRAAVVAGAPLGSDPQEQWLRFYGPKGAWASLSYSQATNQVPGFYQNKIVFIGSKPENPNSVEREEDKFSIPYTRWTGEAVGGMEVLATEFLNLVNGDWLRRPPWWLEVAGLVMSGIFLGGILCAVRPAIGVTVGLSLSVLAALGGLWLPHKTNYWVPWLVVAGGQVPCALAWAVATTRLVELKRELPELESEPEPLPKEAGIAPEVPNTDDYKIFNPPFGKGAFGKVWLARNAVDQWVALKAVFRARFGSNAKPYEREFNGLRRYMPISHKHSGLLRIDFISTQKREGYFYYVMELGDGLKSDWEQNPASYEPRDLAKILERSPDNRLPARECLRIAITLAETLEFLHGESLTHGDIKPQNIIFVSDQPKLADVGLVNEVPLEGQERTGFGTPAYMPPGEPCGTPQADIYGLGMVLYVMYMGQRAESFPAIATTLLNDAGRAEFLRVNSIILRACHPESSRRYGSAKEMACAMREALTGIENELPAKI